MNTKQLVTDFLVTHNKPELTQYLEYPVDSSLGDVALPCFVLAKELKQSPMQIASQLAVQLSQAQTSESHKVLANIEASGPYVNFTMNWGELGSTLIHQILDQQSHYGQGPTRDELILVESPGPNTNKPLHLGHVRNMLLGNAVESILKFAGYGVKRVDIVNDRGVHICKSMLAYQKLGNNAEPTIKSDHYVGSWYVAYDTHLVEHPERDQQAQDMLRLWEDNNPEVRSLRKTMNTRCLDGHAITYARYGTIIDSTYYESDHYLAGKQLVLDGLEARVFRTNDKGNIVADLSNDQEKTVLRSDGTSIYMTQDLALGKVRYEDYQMDRMIYVVGNEQNDHFKALFELFGRLGYPFADQCYHLSYGMIELPDGKMKSRTGNVVDADQLADEMYSKCVELVRVRHPDLRDIEINHRAETIAMSAIKMFILKYDASKNFVFDRETSLAFDGETGPYVLYTYARCQSILKKAQEITNDNLGTTDDLLSTQDITSHETTLLATLSKFGEIVQDAAHQYTPTDVAKYTLRLASEFNTYYHHTKIVDHESAIHVQVFRIGLVQSVAQVINNGLSLLGIETLEQM